MDKSKKYLAISFIVVLIAVIILSFVGMFLSLIHISEPTRRS